MTLEYVIQAPVFVMILRKLMLPPVIWIAAYAHRILARAVHVQPDLP